MDTCMHTNWSVFFLFNLASRGRGATVLQSCGGGLAGDFYFLKVPFSGEKVGDPCSTWNGETWSSSRLNSFNCILGKVEHCPTCLSLVPPLKSSSSHCRTEPFVFQLTEQATLSKGVHWRTKLGGNALISESLDPTATNSHFLLPVEFIC